MGFWAFRSSPQLELDVRLLAIVDISCVQVVMFAAQVASRVWVMRTMDLAAWKKDWEFYSERVSFGFLATLRCEERGWRKRTSRSSEMGRHALKAALERKLLM